MTIRICCFLLLLALVGCASSAKKDYEDALKHDNLMYWRKLLILHPRSEYATQAKAKIDEFRQVAQQKAEKKELADWKAAENANSIYAYVLYLRTHPEGKHSEEAGKTLSLNIDQRVQQITNGEQSHIRPGTEFPIEKLKLTKLVEAFGTKQVKQSYSTTGDFGYYHLYYALNGNVGATESEEIIFFKKTTEKFGLSVSGTQRATTASMLGKENPKTTVGRKKIIGEGFAIITVEGKVSMYAFRKPIKLQ